MPVLNRVQHVSMLDAALCKASPAGRLISISTYWNESRLSFCVMCQKPQKAVVDLHGQAGNNLKSSSVPCGSRLDRASQH